MIDLVKIVNLQLCVECPANRALFSDSSASLQAHQLPGQRHLNRIPILVQRVKT